MAIKTDRFDRVMRNSGELDGYQLLAIAVCKDVAQDYRAELMKSKGKRTTGTTALERWFKSDYGQLLSFGMGEVIIEQIKKEIMEDV